MVIGLMSGTEANDFHIGANRLALQPMVLQSTA